MRAKDIRGALPLLEQACTAGNGGACFRLGIMYQNGNGVKANEKRAKDWFQQACYAGSNSGCDALGH